MFKKSDFKIVLRLQKVDHHHSQRSRREGKHKQSHAVASTRAVEHFGGLHPKLPVLEIHFGHATKLSFFLHGFYFGCSTFTQQFKSLEHLPWIQLHLVWKTIMHHSTCLRLLQTAPSRSRFTFRHNSVLHKLFLNIKEFVSKFTPS